MSKEMVQVFNFNEVEIRTVEKNGEVLFVAKDVATVLGYKDTINAIKLHCKGVAIYHPIQDALGRWQEARVIPESDLYRLTFRSDMPEADRFTDWVASEVLPAIRKTGHYSARKQSNPAISATTTFKSYFSIGKLIGLDRNAAAIAANNAAKAIDGTDVLSIIGQTHLISESQEVDLNPGAIGKHIGGLSAQKVNKLLEEKGFQRKVGDTWEPTEDGKKFGRLIDTGKKHSDGAPVTQLRWFSSIISEISQ